MAEPHPLVFRVVEAVRSHRFRYASEADLQLALHEVLRGAGLNAEREVRLSNADRIDFLVGFVGVEVKVAGSLREVCRQVERYLAHDRVDHVVLVTNRASHSRVPFLVDAGGVTVVRIGGVA